MLANIKRLLRPSWADSWHEKDENLSRNQKGFTIVELNISIIIIGIIAVSILAIFTNYFVLLTRNSISLDMTVDSQNLLRSVTEELRYGAGVRQTNTITDPNGPGGGWNTSNTNFVIITAMPALDASNEYIIDPFTDKPYLDEYVYYKDGLQLYKRLLANPNAIDNKLKTTCPEAIASPTCPKDIKLTDNVETMNFELYDQDDGSTTDPLIARSVVINLDMYKDSFGQPITLHNSIRTTLRNTF